MKMVCRVVCIRVAREARKAIRCSSNYKMGIFQLRVGTQTHREDIKWSSNCKMGIFQLRVGTQTHREDIR
jgi:hypothetical protein